MSIFKALLNSFVPEQEDDLGAMLSELGLEEGVDYNFGSNLGPEDEVDFDEDAFSPENDDYSFLFEDESGYDDESDFEDDGYEGEDDFDDEGEDLDFDDEDEGGSWVAQNNPLARYNQDDDELVEFEPVIDIDEEEEEGEEVWAAENPAMSYLALGGLVAAGWFGLRWNTRRKLFNLLRQDSWSASMTDEQIQGVVSQHIAWFGLTSAQKAFEEITGSAPTAYDSIMSHMPAEIQQAAASTQAFVEQKTEQVQEVYRAGVQKKQDVESSARSGANVVEEKAETSSVWKALFGGSDDFGGMGGDMGGPGYL